MSALEALKFKFEEEVEKIRQFEKGLFINTEVNIKV